MIKYILIPIIILLGSCGPKSHNEIWKHNPYNNKCTLIEAPYHNAMLRLPLQYPQTECYFEYYPDYEDGYYYCDDTNDERWYYFKYLHECTDNGGTY
jgi:hypothetical protein